MGVKIVDRQPVRIVYLRYVGPYGRPLAEFWGRIVEPWIDRRGLGGRATYGIAHDDPHVTPPQTCRYDVGVAVDDAFVAEGDERIGTIPGGRYATAPFLGTPDHIAEAWRAVLQDWLPSSGLQIDARPTFEYYPPDGAIGPDGAFACEITIPVAPLL